MRSKILSLLLAGCVLWGGLSSLRSVRSSAGGVWPPGDFLSAGQQALAVWLRQWPAVDELAFRLLVAGGMREQDGVLLGHGRLLYNLPTPDDNQVEENMEALMDYLEGNEGLYFTLIPTACAIHQQEAPALAPLFNQRRYIGDLYDRLYGLCTTVDVYQRLWEAQDQYLYYRTDTNLTGLGGFTVYQVLGERMGINPRSLDQFEMEHLPDPYWGNLSQQVPRFQVQPDQVTLYWFSRFAREYRVTHWQDGQLRDYYTLFPRHLLQLGGAGQQQILLGGLSQRVEIESSAPYARSLLVLGDETALAYLPFLAVHFQKITFLDLRQLQEDALPDTLQGYDMQLLALQLDSFTQQDLATPLRLLAAAG